MTNHLSSVRATIYLAVALCCTAAGAADFYVDVDSLGGPADDDGPGSRDKPWQTLARATGEKQPRPGAGDTLWIRGGAYKEQVTLQTGGTADRPLTLRAFAEERPVIDGEGRRQNGIVFRDGGAADHVVLQGLTLKKFASGGVGIHVQGRTGIVIRDVDLSAARIGVWISRSERCQVLASEIHHCQAENVLIDTGCSDILVADSHLNHNETRHSLSVYSPANAVRGEGKITSLVPHGPGLARFAIQDLDLRKVRDGTLRGQNEAGSEANPSTILLFPDENPIPDGQALPGGALRLPDGRDWFALRNNPDWAGKPYSPDGQTGLFELGKAEVSALAKAKYAYLAYLFDPNVANRDIRLLRNEVDHSAIQGIWIQRAEGVLIQGNQTHHNGATGIQVESLCRQIWIEGNTSYANCQRHGHETGIWLDETIDAVVQNNAMYENQKGIGVTQCEWVVVRNNLIHGNQAQHVTRDVAGCRGNAGGFWYSGGRHNHLGAPPGAEHNAFVHNTVYGNGAEVSSWGGIQHGFPGYPRVGKNRFLNNLVQDNLGKNPVHVTSVAAVLEGNLYWGATPFQALWGAGAQKATYVLSEAAGWTDYLRATRQDAGSLFSKVEFVAPEKGDFHLKEGSVALDRGCPLTQTTGAGTGDQIPVGEVVCFSAGLRTCTGEVVVPGDEIMIGGALAQVLSLDRTASVLKVDRKVQWKKGDPVTYKYQGAGPDVGALETR